MRPGRDGQCPYGTTLCSDKVSLENRVCVVDNSLGNVQKECPITDLQIVKKVAISERDSKYEYRSFNQEFDIKYSIHVDRLPLTDFVANAA
jgi:hypothetical protein